VLWSIIGLVLALAGLAGLPQLPDQLALWPPFLAGAWAAIRDVLVFLAGDVGRFGVVAVGVAVLLAFNVPWDRLRSSKEATSDGEEWAAAPAGEAVPVKESSAAAGDAETELVLRLATEEREDVGPQVQADQDAAAPRPQTEIERQPYFGGYWRGLPNFQCPYCPHATVDGSAAIERHIVGSHGDHRRAVVAGASSDYTQLARQWLKAAVALGQSAAALPSSGPFERRLFDPTSRIGYTTFTGDSVELRADERGVVTPRDAYEDQVLLGLGAPRLPGRVSWEARATAGTLFQFLVDNPPPTDELLVDHEAFGQLDKRGQIDAAAQEARLRNMFIDRHKAGVDGLLAEIEKLDDVDDRVRNVLDQVGITWATINAVAVFLVGAAERLGRRAAVDRELR
jgi:hypothetical protein